MAFKTPPEITVVASDTAVTKAAMPPDKLLVSSFLAGAYIAFASLLAVVVSAGLKPESAGGLIALVTGAAFTLGLILVVVAGADLLTGNLMLLPLALLQRRITPGAMGLNLVIVFIGNAAGSLFVAYFLAVKSGVVTADAPLMRLTTLAMTKAVTETHWQQFLRAVGCNWLVCLAIWMAYGADDIGGKILAIFFPILGFVAMGFDHVVANMFFLPAAIFAHAPGIHWGDSLLNLLFALLGNVVGAGVFVAGAYWYIYGRAEASAATPQGA